MKTRLAVVCAIGLVSTVTALAVPVAAQSQVKPKPSVPPAGARAHDREFSPLQKFGGQIEQLGDKKYSSTFAGDRLADGNLVVYIVPPHDRGFLRAVTAADIKGLPYILKRVANSYAVQARASEWLRSNEAKLRRQGIILQSWGPYAADNNVLATLQAPTNNQLARLSRATKAETTVTRQTYVSAASAVINEESPYSRLIVISSTVNPPMQATNGY
jgi:hypothetical protein